MPLKRCPSQFNPRRAALSGRWVVVGMFVFASLITGTMWFYWNLHVRPFLPLQKSLAYEFPDSRPRVEGGQRQMHKGSPRILRIIMKVEFDPTREKKRAEKFADRVSSFVRGAWNLRPYETLELHFYRLDPEKTIKEGTFERDVAQLLSKDGGESTAK